MKERETDSNKTKTVHLTYVVNDERNNCGTKTDT